MAEILVDGKKLSELKVTELKDELEKRDLSKKGVKTVLVNRLRACILKELEVAAAEVGDTLDEEEEEESDALNQSDPMLNQSDPMLDQSDPIVDQNDPMVDQNDPMVDQNDPMVGQSDPMVDQNDPMVDQNDPMVDESDATFDQSMDSSAPPNNTEESDLGATQTQETTNQLAEDTSHDTTDMLAKEEHFIPLSNEQRSHGNDEEELLYEGDVAEEATKEEKDDQTDMNMSTDAADEAETANDETVEVRKDDSHVEALNEDSEKKEATKEETKDDIVQLHDMSSTEIEFDKKQNNMASKTGSNHLWIKGLSPSVRAKDLQTLFSSYGKVLSAKVMAKAQSKNERFGYVSMGTAEEARKSIAGLNGTEVKGRSVTVEVATGPPPVSGLSQKTTSTATPNKPRPRLVKLKEKSEVKKSSDVAPIRKSLDSSTKRTSPLRARSRSVDQKKGRGRSPLKSPIESRLSRRSLPSFRRSPRRSPPSHRYRSPSPPVYRDSIRSRLGPRPNMDRRDVRGHRSPDSHMRRVERQEHRFAAEREQEVRRQLAHQQEIMSRRMEEMREREAREREARDRAYRDRENELREREARERQRREMLEKELQQREMREREFRDRERKMKEAFERNIQAKAAKEKEAREREARMQNDRERALREREKRLKEEAERIEAARREQREEALKLQRERELIEKREREEREEREREREAREREEKKRQDEKARASLPSRGPPLSRGPPPSRAPPPSRGPPPSRPSPPPQPSHQRGQPPLRLGKRGAGFDDTSSYESKRHAPEDDYSGSNVFGRLDTPSGKTGSGHSDAYRQGSFSSAGRYGSRGSPFYPMQTSNQSGSGMFGSPQSGRREGGGGGNMSLAGVTPEVMTAAAQVLQNINKQVGLANLPLSNRPTGPTGGGSVASQLHQLAAARPPPVLGPSGYKNNNPFIPFGGAGGYGKKPTPEGDRYGRPMGRSSSHYDNMSHGRGGLFKRM